MVAAVVSAAQAAPITTIVDGSASDAKIRFDSGSTANPSVTDSTSATIGIRYYTYSTSYPAGYGIQMFQLPDLGAVTNPFTDATYSFGARFSGVTTNSGQNTALSVTAIAGARSSAAVQTSDLTAAGTSLGNVMTAYGWVAVSSTNMDTNWAARTRSGTTLTTFLNNAYASGAGANQYVFFRLSDNNSYQGASDFQIAMAENTTSALRPTLSLTYSIPEPGTVSLAASALGMALLRRRRTY